MIDKKHKPGAIYRGKTESTNKMRIVNAEFQYVAIPKTVRVVSITCSPLLLFAIQRYLPASLRLRSVNNRNPSPTCQKKKEKASYSITA